MRLIVVVCFLTIFCRVNAENDPIRGIVIDAETKEPIPFAHVVIDPVISLTNLDGEFVINPHSNSPGLKLEISVMGYDLSSQIVSDPEEYQTIYLTPSTTQLDEVSIMSGNALMLDVFNRFHLNYEMSRKHMVGYYKENLADEKEMYYLAEGIVDVYVPPNVEDAHALVNPIRTRKKVFKELDEDHVFLKGNASDMAQSSIWRKGSFLNPKNRKNYDFVYAGASNIGSKDVFIVEFEPKNARGNTEGRIFIEEESLAVIKLEYHPIIKGNNFWSDVTWVEEYHEWDGRFELFRVSYKGSWEEYDQNYTYQALLVVNESKAISEVPSNNFLMDESHSFFHEAAEDFSESFWEGYNFIKLDVESSQQIASNQR